MPLVVCRDWGVPAGHLLSSQQHQHISALYDEPHICLEVLEGHSDEIFSCAFNYEGDTVITGSKDIGMHDINRSLNGHLLPQDNTCRIWKDNFFTPADEDDQQLGWLRL